MVLCEIAARMLTQELHTHPRYWNVRARLMKIRQFVIISARHRGSFFRPDKLAHLSPVSSGR